MKKRIVPLLLSVLGGLFGSQATAATFAVAVGYNGLGPIAREGVTPLNYADDDALAFASFAQSFGAQTFLLTLPDPDTRERYAAVAATARPPSLVEFRQVVVELRTAIATAKAKGETTQVLLFWSGHGRRTENGDGALAMLDGEFTREILFDDVLAKLPARFVHLLIDACHAEAMVRPRDLSAQHVDVGAAAVSTYLGRQTLERFPHVGVITATTSNAQSHEWDHYRAGVFTHVLLSGLRGGADVNGDGRIEYSEIGAFLSAANRGIADRRAMLQTVVAPPRLDPQTPLVTRPQNGPLAWIVGRPSFLGGFFVETDAGVRIADLHTEPGFSLALAVPADETLHLRTAKAEGEVRLRPGDHVAFDALAFHSASTRTRGSVESALRRGLFQARFGPSYYQGFVDRDTDLVAVHMQESDETIGGGGGKKKVPGAWKTTASMLAFGGAGALAITSGVFGGRALNERATYQGTSLEQPAFDARQRYDQARVVTLSAAVGALVLGGIGTWLRWTSPVDAN